MIDIKLLRDDPQAIKANCARRGADVDVDALYALDQDYLALIRQTEDMRAERNRLAPLCRDDEAARGQMKTLKTDLQQAEDKLKTVKAELDEKMAWMPNLLADDVPDGDGDSGNVELRIVGETPSYDFPLRDHQDLGEHLGIIDTARGAKVAGSGFYYWKGKGAQLASALFYWTQQQLVARGFTLMMTPCAAKAETLYGTGYLPFFADQSYMLEGEDLALIGTSEQTLVGLHADEILDHAELPLRYTAFSPCFRTEAGSYGKESRGIFRVHQFHKVEQIVFCTPAESPAMHQFCLDNEEALLQALGLRYRVVNVCVGDMGAPGYKKFDIEAWFPGYDGYREVTSNTNLTDFQTRRLGIRYADENNKKHIPHTISATAVTDRVVCCILETYQQADGSVIVPEALRALCGFDRIDPA